MLGKYNKILCALLVTGLVTAQVPVYAQGTEQEATEQSAAVGETTQTVTPAATNTPEATVTPEVTALPEETDTPEATATPETTVTLEATVAPEATEDTTDTPAVLQPQTSVSLLSLTSAERTALIERWGNAAKVLAKEYNIYASVMVAQAILESAWGQSQLALQANNLFGIKGSYNGQFVTMSTQEYENGEWITVDAQFRKYPSISESFRDNADKIRNGVSWNSSYYSGAWRENTETYKDATQWLQGRYATDPTYASKLNSLISTYNLTIYDIQGDAMYRIYNPNSGEHFYTKNTQERDNLLSVGWIYEGISWYSAYSGTPVYRVYNKNSGEHHYTTSTAERNNLVKLGWKNEGIGWYSASSKGVPLYRLYNKNATGQYEAGAHHYTVTTTERDTLIGLGWKSEGIGWYGVK
ncbi:MAG: glucosaminidase domain-containing protein [Lachnospiraceae bacterium]